MIEMFDIGFLKGQRRNANRGIISPMGISRFGSG